MTPDPRHPVMVMHRGRRPMATPNATEPIAIGTLVKIRNSGYGHARVAEYRGPLGPRGARVYRVRYRKRPRPAYIEVCEDQLKIPERKPVACPPAENGAPAD